MSKAPDPKIPISVIAVAIVAEMIAPAATARRVARRSPLPNARATGIPMPVEAPMANPNRRNWRLPEAPTAARASTPSMRPTTRVSATA